MFVFPRLGCFIRTTGWGCAPCLSCAENNDPSKPLKSPPFPAPPNAHDRARGRAGRKGGEGGGGARAARRPTADGHTNNTLLTSVHARVLRAVACLGGRGSNADHLVSSGTCAQRQQGPSVIQLKGRQGAMFPGIDHGKCTAAVAPRGGGGEAGGSGACRRPMRQTDATIPCPREPQKARQQYRQPPCQCLASQDTKRPQLLTRQMPFGWAEVSGTVQTWLAVAGRTPASHRRRDGNCVTNF